MFYDKTKLPTNAVCSDFIWTYHGQLKYGRMLDQEVHVKMNVSTRWLHVAKTVFVSREEDF